MGGTKDANILEIKQNARLIGELSNNNGNGQIFIPRVGEYVFDYKVVKVEYEYTSRHAKAIVYVE